MISLKVSRYFYVTVLSLMLVACSSSDSDDSKEVILPEPTNEEVIDQLWQQTVSQLLTEELWLTRDKYDVSHALMQPMQYAFESQQDEKIQELEAFFLQLDTYFEDAISESRGANTQFMYFVSEYLVFQNKREELTGIDLSLHNKLQQWLIDFFNAPAWMWAQEPFSDLLARTSWKLSTANPNYSYYRAMFDEDLFAFGILSNLIYLQENSVPLDSESEFEQLVEAAQPLLQQMLQQEIVTTNTESESVWLFQPGVWWEHPDYAHVGHLELAEELPEARMENIATDSSHMHRWPIWLKSYKRAFTDDDAMLEYIESMELALVQQFNNLVYVPRVETFGAPRINNFFDGHNGVYRYQYETQGESGYGPFQLSGALYSGWYGNLEFADEFVADIKFLLANGMQLSATEIETYVGPNTTRERHPLFTRPDYFTNGMAELNLRVTLALLEE